MRVLLVAMLFASMALADITLTGRFATGTGTFFTPNSAVPCAAETTTTYYKVFNQTFATAGVRTVQLLASTSYPIYIYRGSFDAANPCTNAQTVSGNSFTSTYRYMDSNNDNTQTLQISEAYLFEADIYFFVVTSTSVADLPASTRSFGVRVLDPVATATTTLYVQGASANVWQTPYTDSDSSVQYYGNETYVSVVYTATSTERYDIGAFAVNATAEYILTTSIGIFQGTPTAQQIFEGTNGIFPYDNRDDDGVWVFFVPLTAGQTYTFVASRQSSDAETANIGFFVVPTAAHRLTAGNAVTGTFTEPDAYNSGGSEEGACSNRGDSYVGLPYTTTSFNVLGNIVVAKSSDQYDYNDYLGADLEIQGIDWYTYLYRGNNSESPAGCPILPGITYVSSTDDGTIYNPEASAAVHTLVVSTYSSSPSVDATSGIVIFYFAGPTIGESVSVPTGAPTPAPPTTSTPTTSTPTTSTPTTSSPTPAPTCAPRSATTIISFNAPGQCNNASVVAILKAVNTAPIVAGAGVTNATCVSGTGSATTITTTTIGTTVCPVAINTTAIIQAYETFYGFTDVTVTFPTVAPTTGTPTTSTPAPAAGTTSGAVNVVASFVVIFAALALLF